MEHDNDPIIVFTPYTFEQVRELQRHIYRKIRTLFYIMAVLLVLYAVQILIQGVETSAISSSLAEGRFTPAAALVLVFFVAFLGMVSFGLFYTRNKHTEVSLRYVNGQTFTFRENGYEVQLHNPDADDRMVYAYGAIKRVEETKNMFYLFGGKYAAALVDKQGFQNGSHEEFRSLLKMHVPPRRCSFL